MKENRDVQCFKTDTLTSTRSRYKKQVLDHDTKDRETPRFNGHMTVANKLKSAQPILPMILCLWIYITPGNR